jgi:SAM-dependent methyltransferase
MMKAVSIPLPGRSEEEINEVKRHDRLYQEEIHQAEVIDPVHWGKFDRRGESIHPYIYLVKCLGDLAGKRVLDCGCGNGRFSVILAKRGATVEGFDISNSGIEIAREYAALNGVADRVYFRAMSFYDIDYPEHRFDFIVGKDILHHVSEKERLVAPLHRSIKPDGKIAFMEPFRIDDWLEKLRLKFPVSVDDDEPANWSKKLCPHDLDVFRGRFHVTVKPFHLFSRLDRVFSSGFVRDGLGKVDVRLMKILPFLKKYARTMIIEMTPQ